MSMTSPPDPPLVSIGLPVFNEEKDIRVAMDSLLGQTYRRIELVVSDNASTDRTGDICRDYAARDSRIRYVRQSRNLGMTRNQNIVVELASGDYFMWGSGNDRWQPQFIEKCLPALLDDDSVVLCYPIIEKMDAEGRPAEERYPIRLDTRGMGISSRANLVAWGLSSCELFYGLHRLIVLKRTNLFRNVISPDNCLVFELALHGAFAHVPLPLFTMRMPPPSSRHLRDSIEAYRSVFYPEDRKRFRLWLTHWRFLYEHLAAVCRVPGVPMRRKPILLLSALFAVLARKGKHMIHDLIEAVGLPRP